nr:ORF1 [Torque teno felis virus]
MCCAYYYRRPWRLRRRRIRRRFRPWFRRRRRRGFRRRTKVRRRRRRYKRRKQNVTLWNPESTARCTITGFTLGITTDNLHAINRCYNTTFDDNVATKLLRGGGVTLKLFSLKFLWLEHRLYHNWWSRTNDGFDLARYYGTKWFLKPHRDIDYIFWYDSEVGTYTSRDYMRAHPVQLLANKNAHFIRSQKYGKNHKTHKVMIRPPANITSQWKYQSDWYNTPLFLWGISMIDWKFWFSSIADNPLPFVTIMGAYKVGMGSGSNVNPMFTLDYCPYIDTGTGNSIKVLVVGNNIVGSSIPTSTQRYPVDWATDIPYWMSLYGQNRNMDMNVLPKGQPAANMAIWLEITWPPYSSSQIIAGQSSKDFIKILIQASDAARIARSGPFVQANITEVVQIPLMYKSYWKWGGSIFTGQPVINMQSNAQTLVSIKNPLLQQRSLIYPWDTRNGILTGTALQRICGKSTTPDERPPIPGIEHIAGHADQEAHEPFDEETEESETDTDGEEDERPALYHLKECLKREQLKRRRIKHVLMGLLKHKEYEKDPLLE